MISRKLLLGMTLAGALIAGCAATDYDQGKYDRDTAAAEPAPLPPRTANTSDNGPTHTQTAVPNEGNSAPRGSTGAGGTTRGTTTNP